MVYVTEKQLDQVFQKIDALERRIQKLENNSSPTVPIYDSTNFPQDAVEGQIVIAPIV